MRPLGWEGLGRGLEEGLAEAVVEVALFLRAEDSTGEACQVVAASGEEGVDSGKVDDVSSDI